MIGFGELRKRSLQWGLDISAVERAYVTDWLLKGIFDDARLSPSLVLRGSSALRYAYGPGTTPGLPGNAPGLPGNAPGSAEYAPAEPPEFFIIQPVTGDMSAVLAQAAQAAAGTHGGLKFSLTGYDRGTARFEYVGPLGRRSAAQPLILLSLIPGQPRRAPVSRSLVHPFGDACPATVQAVALEELVAGRVAVLAQRPRARDAFDLWFALTRAGEQIDWTLTRELATQLARETNAPLPRPDAPFQPEHRAALERSWDSALKNVPRHVSFAQLEKDLSISLQSLFPQGQ